MTSEHPCPFGVWMFSCREKVSSPGIMRYEGEQQKGGKIKRSSLLQIAK